MRRRCYWSYRGDKMPKVSQALADAFFDAFIGNGNVRYLPSSEPVAVHRADGAESFLSVRTARVVAAGSRPRPRSSSSRRRCIACIGEDIPEALLTRLGVPLVAGGPPTRAAVVSPLLETRQPNVYLAGDLLSPAYFETTDFDATRRRSWR